MSNPDFDNGILHIYFFVGFVLAAVGVRAVNLMHRSVVNGRTVCVDERARCEDPWRAMKDTEPKV